MTHFIRMEYWFIHIFLIASLFNALMFFGFGKSDEQVCRVSQIVSVFLKNNNNFGGAKCKKQPENAIDAPMNLRDRPFTIFTLWRIMSASQAKEIVSFTRQESGFFYFARETISNFVLLWESRMRPISKIEMRNEWQTKHNIEIFCFRTPNLCYQIAIKLFPFFHSLDCYFLPYLRAASLVSLMVAVLSHRCIQIIVSSSKVCGETIVELLLVDVN